MLPAKTGIQGGASSVQRRAAGKSVVLSWIKPGASEELLLQASNSPDKACCSCL
jgi:hypothetical protein